VTRLRHLTDDALCVRSFWHALNVSGLNLVAQSFFNGQTANIVLMGPAEIADWTDVYEADLDIVFGLNSAGQSDCHGGRGHECFDDIHEFSFSESGSVPALLVLAVLSGFIRTYGTRDPVRPVRLVKLLPCPPR